MKRSFCELKGHEKAHRGRIQSCIHFEKSRISIEVGSQKLFRHNAFDAQSKELNGAQIYLWGVDRVFKIKLYLRFSLCEIT